MTNYQKLYRGNKNYFIGRMSDKNARLVVKKIKLSNGSSGTEEGNKYANKDRWARKHRENYRFIVDIVWIAIIFMFGIIMSAKLALGAMILFWAYHHQLFRRKKSKDKYFYYKTTLETVMEVTDESDIE
ncbi:unnamed protein product [Blepharisma stoltei]|uniref:Uncharacterized protein n=1 Tax=Blepharisma stoltei TaxID=1481888 RepID=A0AAU9JN79_9CILI|nr:unnamed protein product [Blepharisma stoltei]